MGAEVVEALHAVEGVAKASNVHLWPTTSRLRERSKTGRGSQRAVASPQHRPKGSVNELIDGMVGN
jgi:hypothetical protein